MSVNATVSSNGTMVVSYPTPDELREDPISIAVFAFGAFVVFFSIVTLVLHLARRNLFPFSRRPQFFLNSVLVNSGILSAAYMLRSFAILDCFTSKPLFWYAYCSCAWGLVLHSWQVLFYSLVNKKVSQFLRKLHRKDKKSKKKNDTLNDMASIESTSFLLRHAWLGRTLPLFFFALFATCFSVGVYYVFMYVFPDSRSSPPEKFWDDHILAGNFDTRCNFLGETLGYAVLLLCLLIFIVPMLVVYLRQLRNTRDGLGLVAELRILALVWSITFALFASLQTVHPIWPMFPLAAVFATLFIMVWYRAIFSSSSKMNSKVSALNKRQSAQHVPDIDLSAVEGDEAVELGSLEEELKSEEFRELFTQFLRSELCLETILFIDMASQYRIALVEWKNKDRAWDIFQDIWNYFVASDATLQVNLSSAARKPIAIAKGNLDLAGKDNSAFSLDEKVFDAASRETMRLLQNDQYPRFLLLKSQGKISLGPLTGRSSVADGSDNSSPSFTSPRPAQNSHLSSALERAGSSASDFLGSTPPRKAAGLDNVVEMSAIDPEDSSGADPTDSAPSAVSPEESKQNSDYILSADAEDAVTIMKDDVTEGAEETAVAEGKERVEIN